LDADMLKFEFAKRKDRALKILCIGAHSDDIEIGCGGTILRFLVESNNAEIYWVVFAANAEREVEATKSANLFLKDAKHKNIIVKNFRDGFFPYIGAELKEYFERLKQEFCPDIVFTHYGKDLHQDHRTISELTWNTFRDHLILEYEIPKFDGDLGSPNFFVHLDKAECRKKITKILNYYRSQLDKKWFTRDTFWSILRLRGIESNAPGKYAEAFYCRKIIW
jgi:LmbE family N-acetylglucosaminyl deacetylase